MFTHNSVPEKSENCTTKKRDKIKYRTQNNDVNFSKTQTEAN